MQVKLKDAELPAKSIKRSNIVIENIKQKQEEIKAKNERNFQKARDNATKLQKDQFYFALDKEKEKEERI